MVQNRNKLIEIFIGNISNAIVHNILERAISKDIEIADRYRKELKISFDAAKKYREKINPLNRALPAKDVYYIKKKIINRVRAELMLRVSKGYKNIDLELIPELAGRILKDTNIE